MGAPAIAMWFTAASTAYTIYSADQARSAEEEAGRRAESLAYENAGLIEREGEREQQLAREAMDGVEAEGRARAAASGFDYLQGSQGLVIDDVARKHRESLEWMKESTKSQADITRKGGVYARQAANASGSATFAQGIGSSINAWSSAGNANNWWQ